MNPKVSAAALAVMAAAALTGCKTSEKTPLDYDALATKVEARIFKMDTHSHVDVNMAQDEPPTPIVSLDSSLAKAGMDGIVMTFAVDYVAMGGNGNKQYDAYGRFSTALAEQDRILSYNHIDRTLNGRDIQKNIAAGRPVIIQSVEGAHFLEGDTTRLREAYRRGLRILGLLHDTDASPALGDIYTNEPKFGGLTEFGAATIRESERLGMLVDLAHADDNTVRAALKIATKPVIISHTGLNTRLGTNEKLGKMMYPRLISKEMATEVARKGGVIGVWPHLAFSAAEYAANIKALVDVVGIDHVTIGTDTKITPEIPMGNRPKKDEPKGQNHVWKDEPTNFYHATIRELLKLGYSEKDIAKICGGNFIRIFTQATK